MNNGRLSTQLNSPLGAVLAVVAMILMYEFLFMALLHEVLIPLVPLKLADSTWNAIDAITLTLIISPVLYFLVFRNIYDKSERLRLLYNDAQDAIIITDAQCLITEWNHAAEKLFQYRREEAVGRQMHSLIAPERFRADADRGYANFLESGKGPIIGNLTVISAMRRDGSEFLADLSVSVIKLDGEWNAIGIVRDISQRVQHEKAIAQLQNLQKQILDSLTEGIYGVDLQGNIVFENPAAMAMLGWNSQEVTGQNAHALIHHSRTDGSFYPPGECHVHATLLDGNFRHSEDEVFWRKDGTSFPVSYTCTPRKNEVGEVVGVIMSFQDITERKQSENAFHALIGTATTNVGEMFFQESISSVSRLLGVECVIVGELVDGNKIRALAMQLDGMMIEHYEYPLSGSPCNNVIQNGYSEYPEGVCQSFPSCQNLIDLRAEAYVGAPIRNKDGKTIGILCAISRHRIFLLPMLKGVFEIIAARAGAEISRTQMEKESLESGRRIKNALEDAIGAVAATLEQRDPYTAGHQRRVAELAAAIGREMGLTPDVVEGIYFGGLIHDIGKISIPAEILGKPGRITGIEFGLIRTHAEDGYQIVKDIAFPWPVADMVRQHHERMNGTGYPQGLKGDQIVMEARILAVADVVEAMSTNRPYRPGLGMDKAINEITNARGVQLDPVAVDACLRVIREKGFAFTK